MLKVKRWRAISLHSWPVTAQLSSDAKKGRQVRLWTIIGSNSRNNGFSRRTAFCLCFRANLPSIAIMTLNGQNLFAMGGGYTPSITNFLSCRDAEAAVCRQSFLAPKLHDLEWLVRGAHADFPPNAARNRRPLSLPFFLHSSKAGVTGSMSGSCVAESTRTLFLYLVPSGAGITMALNGAFMAHLYHRLAEKSNSFCQIRWRKWWRRKSIVLRQDFTEVIQ